MTLPGPLRAVLAAQCLTGGRILVSEILLINHVSFTCLFSTNLGGDFIVAILSIPCSSGNFPNIAARSSRTASSQSESASISAKALKMLTLQKRQLDHLQQQVE